VQWRPPFRTTVLSIQLEAGIAENSEKPLPERLMR
jgi:hypothetical protein